MSLVRSSVLMGTMEGRINALLKIQKAAVLRMLCVCCARRDRIATYANTVVV